MKYFKILLLLIFISCSGTSSSEIENNNDSSLSEEIMEIENSPEVSIATELTDSDIDPYNYKNHSQYYICEKECSDNAINLMSGIVNGELLLKIENEILSDLDYISSEEILLTGHNSGKIYLYNTNTNSYEIWFDMSSLAIVNGSQESGIHNIELTNDMKSIFVSYTNKQNRFKISKFNIPEKSPELASEQVLLDENHISSAHYCGTLVLDEKNERLFGCLGDSQLDQLSLVNWNIHGSIFSIDINTGEPHPLNPLPNNEVEFSTDAVMNRSSFEPDSRIIASGFRNPWNFTLSNNRKFLVIPDVGWHDYEELNIFNLESETSEYFGWPLVEGPFFRKHYPRELLKFPVTNFFTSEKEVAVDIAFNKSTPPILYYYHNNNGASIIGGQFFSVGNSWDDYYIFTDMYLDYFTLVKFRNDDGNLSSHFHLRNKIENKAPIISLEKDFFGNVLAILADGSIYRLSPELD